MKQMSIILFLIGSLTTSFSQVNYGTPTNAPLPEKIQGIRQAIDVIHFPKETDPIKIKDTYYWKHLTSILCKESQIEIIEYGAYIYYNDQWNLRREYPLKELNKTFKTKDQIMEQAEPYTWTKNYRTGTDLFGGWALWYFIGETSTGETVCGFETINTTDNLVN